MRTIESWVKTGHNAEGVDQLTDIYTCASKLGELLDGVDLRAFISV